MYNRFFGNYLFSKGYVTKEQLLPALTGQTDVVLRPRILTIYLEHTAPDENTTTTEYPSFLKLGQYLIQEGVFTYEQFADILEEYRSQERLQERNTILNLIDGFAASTRITPSVFGRNYLELLYNNFIRFIGEDFTALPPEVCNEFTPKHCVMQSIHGDFEVNTYISMDTKTALSFAGRYSGDVYTQFDEYVQASIEDFLNLHNGLFIVNASNDHSSEMNIGILEKMEQNPLPLEKSALRFPVYFSFGLINFIIEMTPITE